MNELNQLLLNFNQKQNFNYNDFYVSECNFYAFQLIESWPKWEKRIINVYGEKNSGKSHLSSIFKTKYKAKIIENINIDNELFKKLKVSQNIILENFEKISDEKLLYSFFNFIDQDNKYLIINSNKSLIDMKFDLKDLVSRINNFMFAEIKKPDDDLIFALILKNFTDKQINIDKKVIDYIVKRIDRSYSKISEFIYKIDQISLKMKKRIDIKLIKEII